MFDYAVLVHTRCENFAMSDTRDIDQLIATVNALEDFDGAVSSLRLLVDIDKHAAVKLALEVLIQQRGDVYFQASCFDVFYSASLPRALEYINENANDVDVYLLGTMMSNVVEDIGIIQYHPEIEDTVIVLKKAAMSRSSDEIMKIKHKLDWFNQTYS